MSVRFEAAPIAIPGFRFGGLAAGIKKSGKPDLALAVADEPAAAAGVFTTNLVRAAPVLVAAERVAAGRARAILANSGCANAATGEPGLAATRASTAAIAAALGVDAGGVLPASTGVIGALLPAEKIAARAGDLAAALHADGAAAFADAILTTDRGPKVVHARGAIGGRPFSVLGIAKGAGMIGPAMAPSPPHATMLAFLFTDAVATGTALGRALARVADDTFNCASVDGDTSTNDTLLVLASGRAGTDPGAGELPSALVEAMHGVCDGLARMMVADGEGAEHLVELHVRGLASDADARAIARTIAASPLTKTALFGQDPNWGRILAAAGRAGVAFDPSVARIVVGDVCIVEGGCAVGPERERAAHAIMTRPEYRLEVVLGSGPGHARWLTCDLGIAYVRCNADYRS
jgi:glutamate N-acetyltransferase/amino-acid N-acetyltransferase